MKMYKDLTYWKILEICESESGSIAFTTFRKSTIAAASIIVVNHGAINSVDNNQYLWPTVHSLIPVASFTSEINPRLAKRPLKTSGRLANRELTFLVKEATGDALMRQWTGS